jgi:16S rRNA (cytidine1402-2'-O)-methyltransferase
MPAGRLLLVPTPLGPDEDPRRVLPPATIEAAAGLDYVIAESAKTARAVLRRLPLAHPLQSIEIRELNVRTAPEAIAALLEPVLAGRDAGLLSEAGCPGVADPGAALVRLAHERGIAVVPLVGPSALLLALMASGMEGQRFSFAGYVPVEAAARLERLRALERRSAVEHETVLMIETPYRTQALFDALLQALAPETLVGVAADLTLGDESVATRTVAQWRARRPELARTPTVFTLLAAPRAGARAAPGADAGGQEPRGAGARRGRPRPAGVSAGAARRRPR